MRFEPYSHEKHLEALCDWFEHYQIAFDLSDFPKNGFVAIENDEPLAACFLNLMEGSSAMIDGLIVKPSVRRDRRHLALNGVVSAMIERARELKIKRILAYTTDVSTLERGHKFGFIKQPHAMLALDLRS